MIYLDHAATTPVPRAVAEAMLEVLTEQYGNPSSQYPFGAEMKKRVELWRRAVAALLDCPPEALAFTSCGTEGDNWALRAAAWQNRRLGRHIVTTAVEHSAVLEACKQLAQEGYEVTYIFPDQTGGIAPEQVLEAVRPDTAAVSLMLVNNELGNRYPVEAVARGLAARNPKTLLHTDAVQGLGTFSARDLGADFVTVSAHKIGGPKGIGALYMGPRVKNPRPLLAGGGQERGLRAGTEATAQMAGFARAAELRLERREEIRSHLAGLRARALERLQGFPDLTVLGGGEMASHILALSLEGWPSQNIVNDLGAQGICVSAGSACHQGKPSHVVAALKLPKRTASGVIRLSFGPETAAAEVDACVEALRRHHDTRMPMLR
ncbi:cysteine desulfurase family protein [Oscillospiraceae bacterium 38-13]